MNSYSLAHLADHALLRGLHTIVSQDRATTASMLAHLAEVDARKPYLPAAYPSMFAFCVGELRLPGDAVFKRIRAARTARQFPAIFTAICDGRLNVSTVAMLAPHSRTENAADLLAAAEGRTRSDLELLLASRFPQPDLATQVRVIAPAAVTASPAPAPVTALSCQLAPGPVGYNVGSHEQPNPAPVAPSAPRAKVTPLSPQRFALQVSLGQATHDKLRRAQELLAHALPSGDVEQVLDRALDALIHELERRRLAATDRPRPRRSCADRRYIPAQVKREVTRRDGDPCTFVSDSGRRCSERRFLEFDHVDPVARGGLSTVDGMRLLCRAHNQHAADFTFGKGFMREKREEARHCRMEARTLRAAAAETTQAGGRATRETLSAGAQEVIPWLRELGFRPDEARRAAARVAESIPAASLEERVRQASKSLAPPSPRQPAHVANSPA